MIVKKICASLEPKLGTDNSGLNDFKADDSAKVGADKLVTYTDCWGLCMIGFGLTLLLIHGHQSLVTHVSLV